MLGRQHVGGGHALGGQKGLMTRALRPAGGRVLGRQHVGGGAGHALGSQKGVMNRALWPAGSQVLGCLEDVQCEKGGGSYSTVFSSRDIPKAVQVTARWWW